MIENILGGSYAQRFLASNAQSTINWYPVVSKTATNKENTGFAIYPTQEDNKTNLALYPTPGLTLFATLTGTTLRAFQRVKTHAYDTAFAVMDTTLYEISNTGTVTSRGTLTSLTGTDRVYIVCNLNNEVGIFGNAASYVWNMSTSTLTKITDVLFPGGITYAAYTDQYAVVVSAGAVFDAGNSAFLTWTGSQNYSTTFTAAPTLAVGVFREQIFNFTSNSIEVFINDGTSPYSRLSRTTISCGITNKDTLATFKDGFVFLGKSDQGGSDVYYYDGYNIPQSITQGTAIPYAINKGDLTAAYGYIVQQKDGQFVYYLTIPSLNTTFCYSFSAQMWFNRQSLNPNTSSQDIFRGLYHISYNSNNLFADTYSGKIFKEDYSATAEDSTNAIYRERISQEIFQEDKHISHRKFILDASNGVGAVTLSFSWSDDGGYTFSTPVNLYLGDNLDYSYRSVLDNLGTSRRRVYKITMNSSTTSAMIQNAYVEMSPDVW